MSTLGIRPVGRTEGLDALLGLGDFATGPLVLRTFGTTSLAQPPAKSAAELATAAKARLAAAVDTALRAVLYARDAAAALVRSPPRGADQSAINAWKFALLKLDGGLQVINPTQTLKHEGIIPLLKATAAQARVDPRYAEKWLTTARAAESLATQILKDYDQQGILRAVKATLEEVGKAIAEGLRYLGQGIIDAAKIIFNPWVLVGLVLGGGLLYAVGPRLLAARSRQTGDLFGLRAAGRLPGRKKRRRRRKR